MPVRPWRAWAFGLERLSPKYTLHLQDEIWEFRLKGKDGIARALYVTAQGKRIVVVRVAGVHQENAKDAAQRNQGGPEAGE